MARRHARLIAVPTILLSLAAPAARAQAPAPPDATPDPAPCRALLGALPFISPDSKTQAVVSRPDPQTCRFAPFVVHIGGTFGYVADSVTLRGIADGAATGTLGPDVAIEARGLRPDFPAMNALTRYISKVGANPFDIILETSIDPVAHRFTLRRFAMLGETLGTLEITASLTGISLPANALEADPDDLDAQAMSSIGLQSLTLRLSNHGFIEHMVVPALASQAVSGNAAEDPEPVIAAAQAGIAAGARAMLPSFGMSTDSADAVARFVTDFPHPRDTLRCSLAADPPLRMPANGPDPSALGPMLTAAHPTCSYGPER